MKPVRWTDHALGDLRQRDISRDLAEATLDKPEKIVSGSKARQVYQRRYHDSILEQEMLLRVIVEETTVERIVITLYKTSKLRKYE